MAYVEITQGVGTPIWTDSVSGNQAQIIKLADGREGSADVIRGDETYGLDVDVTRVAGTVEVREAAYDGSATDTTLVLTNATTAYACPATAPTGQYMLIIHNASDTDVSVRLTTGTTAGWLIKTGTTYTKVMGAGKQLFLYCASAGKTVNVSYEEI
jgi:hypothetical protein